MTPKPSKGNRWYDSHPQISKALDILEEMPHQYRQVISRAIIYYTEENKLLGTPEELKSLGHEKVLGLIQSKARRRWYDQDPTMHRAINNVLLMTGDERSKLSYRLTVALESIESYTTQCNEEDRLIDTGEIEQIVSDIFSRNINDLLDITGKPRRGPQQEGDSDSDADSKVVDEDDTGMRLSAMAEDSENG